MGNMCWCLGDMVGGHAFGEHVCGAVFLSSTLLDDSLYSLVSESARLRSLRQTIVAIDPKLKAITNKTSIRIVVR